jgi:hypothetical protein
MNNSVLAPDPYIQARRRHRLERLSILVHESWTLPVEVVADLPMFCEPLLGEDGSTLVGISYWSVDATNDPEGDHAWGEFLGEEAIAYVRRHDKPEFLTLVLLWMGGTLHFEDRCPGPLENGFVYRVLRDYPDAVVRVFMAVHQQHPEALN